MLRPQGTLTSRQRRRPLAWVGDVGGDGRGSGIARVVRVHVGVHVVRLRGHLLAQVVHGLGRDHVAAAVDLA